ncbi:MAG: zf-HC2 domain-containing protein [Clostridium sp.]|uniref:zf-HC2 domain-containing protein n=1 Tax=Clostridium sp. TaxID=1506 RepID=UPI003F3563A8
MRKECKLIRELMPLYVDGVCDKEVMNYIDEHLKVCEECKSAYYILSDEEFDIKKPEDIDEEKVFLKVKRKNKRKVVIGIVVGVVITLLLGTNLTSKFTKYRFNKYINENFAEYDLEVTNFRYDDPESSGFGLNNGFYIADVYAKNEKENPDIKFNIYTEGTFLRINNNYKNTMEEKVITKDRISEAYANDMKTVLYKYGEVKDIEVTVIDDKDLEVNMQYTRNIDKKLDMNIKVFMYDEKMNMRSITKKVDKIDKELKINGFTPKIYDIEIINFKEDNLLIKDVKSDYKNIDELENNILKNRKL